MPEITHTSKLQPLDDTVIEEDNRKTMIKVDHVSMEFNMASEKLNSLKEYAIAIARRKLFFESFTALDDISFEVKKGDVFGILGTNGSGKSTLLKIIAGVLEPTKGKCDINGNIAPLIELGAGFDMELSARENIYLNGSLLGYSKDFVQQHFDDIVEFAEIEKFLDMPMKNYSSGMIARIAFAIATVIVPEILIVDEVLSVGDFMFQQKCEDRINELISQHGVTVLIVSHANDQIERLCNKAIWIEKGHTRIMGDATQVCNAYRVLGGRTGSKESEEIVYEALQQSERHEAEQPFKTIDADDPTSIALRLAKTGWHDIGNVVFVPGHTHGFAVSAAAIAGTLDAPIIPYSYDAPVDTIKRGIIELQPKNAYIVGHDFQVEPLIDSPEITQFCNICTIPCGADCSGLRTGILQAALQLGGTKSHEAFIGLLDDSNSAFLTSPYSFKTGAKYLIFKDKEEKPDALTIELLKKLDVTTVIPLGGAKDTDIASQFESAGFEIKNMDKWSDNPYVDTTTWVANKPEFNNDSINIASSIPAHWPDLIGLGTFSGKQSCPILLANPLDLDDTASCIEYMEKHTPKEITFTGSRGVSEIDRRILWAATLPEM